MESSIAVFLKRWLACELPPTEAVCGSARTPAQLQHTHGVSGHRRGAIARSPRTPARATSTKRQLLQLDWRGYRQCTANLPG